MPEILFKNGRFLSCTKIPPTDDQYLSKFSWLLIDDQTGKIIKTGSENEPKASKIVDFNNKLVLPGLWDTHIHPYSYGHLQKVANLVAAKGKDDIIEILKAKLQSSEQPPWLEGVQWDQDSMGGYFPSRKDLDLVSETVPIVIFRRCWHICAVNTATLKKSNLIDENGFLMKEYSNNPGIETENGVPTGIFKEDSIFLLNPVLKIEDTDEEKFKILDLTLKNLAQHGLTSICGNEGAITNFSNAYEIYSKLYGSFGSLPVRVNFTREINDDFSAKPMNLVSKDYLRCDKVKIFMDGSLGSNTAYLSKNYKNIDSRGMLILKSSCLKDKLTKITNSKYQLEAHAIGDGAFSELLDACTVFKTTLNRPIFTHCQIVNDQILNRLRKHKDMKIVANIQPQFTESDLPIIESKIGKENLKFSYCWKSLQNSGMVIAGGSDAPVEPPNPILGMACAFKNPLHEVESLNLAETLGLYTINAAFASFKEKSIGLFKTGYVADMTVLDTEDDLESILLSKKDRYVNGSLIDSTYINGQMVYSKNDEKSDFFKTDPNHPGKGGMPKWRCPCQR